MLIRALIVLLLVLNVGVALWWLLRDPAPVASPEASPGVARLQLVDAPSAGAGGDPSPAPPPASVVVTQCHSFGPFEDEATLEKAQSRLQPVVAQLQRRTTWAGTARNWRVYLPAFADIAAAETVANDIAEAGFLDYYVLRDGEQAGSVALGLFRNEAPARERQAALAAAGFDAQVAPVGAGPPRYWLDIGAGEFFDAPVFAEVVGAGGLEPLDCSELDAGAEASGEAAAPTPAR